MKTTIKNLLAALMISCCGASAVLAADNKTEEPKTTQNTSTAKPGQLAEESLKEMLDSLGYDYRVVKTTSGSSLYYVKVDRGGLTFEVSVGLSGDKSRVWNQVCVAEIKPDDAAHAERLLKLLDINKQYGPSHFEYTPSSKRMNMTRPIDNRGITAKILRESIDGLAEDVVATRDHWDTSKWGGQATANNKTEAK